MTDEQHTLPRWIHKVRAGSHSFESEDSNQTILKSQEVNQHRNKIEPWLATLCQAEHLNLLVGNGLTTAIACQVGAPSVAMSAKKPSCDYSSSVWSAATSSAGKSGRGEPNIEDFIRGVQDLIQGLNVILADPERDDEFIHRAQQIKDNWSKVLTGELQSLLTKILKTESSIRSGIEQTDGEVQEAQKALRLLCSFLLTFASRGVTRERLHVFTTNYDRIIEFGADLLGLRVMDRFVGGLEPVFRASRLGIDMHYNPPGIRGEPRYLEGVIRLTKLHGSIDWHQDKIAGQSNRIVRRVFPFGTALGHSAVPLNTADSLMIYPNPAKDLETLEYPYAELFRDFATAVCQPNAVLFTYGYGFGDDHINRVVRDMLTIPSTHLVIVSYNDAGDRIYNFCNSVANEAQISLLIGPHFGDLSTLVDNYLPKPAIEQTTWEMAKLINRRTANSMAQALNDLSDTLDTEIP